MNIKTSQDRKPTAILLNKVNEFLIKKQEVSPFNKLLLEHKTKILGASHAASVLGVPLDEKTEAEFFSLMDSQIPDVHHYSVAFAQMLVDFGQGDEIVPLAEQTRKAFEGKIILEIGCGYGVFVEFISEYCRAIGCDINPKSIERAAQFSFSSPGCPVFEVMDGRKVNKLFHEPLFDAVVTLHYNDVLLAPAKSRVRRTMKSIADVLIPGGRYYDINVPTTHFPEEMHKEQNLTQVFFNHELEFDWVRFGNNFSMLSVFEKKQ